MRHHAAGLQSIIDASRIRSSLFINSSLTKVHFWSYPPGFCLHNSPIKISEIFILEIFCQESDFIIHQQQPEKFHS
jgi:hypothetical protein